MRIQHVFSVVIFAGIPVAFLDAAPVPKDFGDTVENYEWKGEIRKRMVKKLNCGGVSMEFVKIPKGSFIMGSDKTKDADTQDYETPPHKVTLTQDLWVGKYPVTLGQFAEFVKATKYQSEAETGGQGGWGYDEVRNFQFSKKFNWKNTGWKQTDMYPVTVVSWNDAAAFCDWMSSTNKIKTAFVKKDGEWDLVDYKNSVGLRLLTDAEYEYANRGGTTTHYFTGDKSESLEGYANVADQSLNAVAPLDPKTNFADDACFTSPVGKYRPNGFGLYDMTGNLLCWCADWFDRDAYQKHKAGATNPVPNQSGEQRARVMRGGSWYSGPTQCRAACRLGCEPHFSYCYFGFRVCLTVE